MASGADRLRSNTPRVVPNTVVRSVRLTIGRSANTASDALAHLAPVAAAPHEIPTSIPSSLISGAWSSSTTER